jgi:sugar-specific transcriptional regulator TrmB
VTVSKYTKYRKTQLERLSLTASSYSNAKNRRYEYEAEEDKNLENLLFIWPKMVEYAGLSEYESKVYLSLLALGSSGARKLSLRCKVPRTKVYGTIKKLIDYGLVVEIPGKPKCFAAASPADAFKATIKLVESKAHDFADIVENLTETHELVISNSSPKKKIVWYIDCEDDITGKCHEIINQTKRGLTIITSADGLALLFNSAPRLLDQLHEQGFKVELNSPLDPRTNPLARELSYLFKVKKLNISTPVLFIDSDHERFVLARMAKPGGRAPSNQPSSQTTAKSYH